MIPESPRWLIERKREDKAKGILAKVAGAAFAESESAAIRASLAGEKGTWGELLSRKLAVPLLLGIALVAMMRFRPEGFLPSRQRAAEMHSAPPGQAVGSAGLTEDSEVIAAEEEREAALAAEAEAEALAEVEADADTSGSDDGPTIEDLPNDPEDRR